MTIDEAIKHCEEVAENHEKSCDYYKKHNMEEYVPSERKYIEEHRQLAEWLRELQKYRAIFEKVGKILADNGYTIDDLDTIFGKVNEEVKADADSD